MNRTENEQGTKPSQVKDMPYRLAKEIWLHGETKPHRVTFLGSERPLTTGEISMEAERRAAWPLSTTPEPDWGKVFAEYEDSKVPIDPSALDRAPDTEDDDEDDDGPHIPEPTGVLRFTTDEGRHLVVPRESVRFIEFVQYDQAGNVVRSESGWPKPESGGEH